MNNSELRAMADDLALTAKENIIDVAKHIASKRLTKPHDRHWRKFEIDDIAIKVCFTFHPMGSRKFWLLSVSRQVYLPLDPEILSRIIFAFYGEGSTTEIPSQIHPGIVRQFVQFVERDDEERSFPIRCRRRTD